MLHLPSIVAFHSREFKSDAWPINQNRGARVDGKKSAKQKRKALPFWLGAAIGIALTVLVVVGLKVLRVL